MLLLKLVHINKNVKKRKETTHIGIMFLLGLMLSEAFCHAIFMPGNPDQHETDNLIFRK